MFLCIDTATEQAGVVVVGDVGPCRFQKLDTRHASEKLMETIDNSIQKADIKLSDLKGVMVIRGPGSFTGLRVGLAVANQFAHQLSIPIVGLRTDEWHSYSADEKDFFYLQTMNRDQVYVVGFGRFKRDFPHQIISVSDAHYELGNQKEAKWLGQISDEHSKKLSGIPKLAEVRPTDEIWMKTAAGISMPSAKTYQLIEPFYGKEPTITQSKHNL